MKALDFFPEGILLLNNTYVVKYANLFALEKIGISKLSVKIKIRLPDSGINNKFPVRVAIHNHNKILFGNLYECSEKDYGYPFMVLMTAKMKNSGEEINLLKKALTVESLTRSRKIRKGELTEAVNEVLLASSKATQTNRVNAWVYNDERSEIICIGNYDARHKKFVKQESLPRIQIPKYFELFEHENIVVVEDALNDKRIKELKKLYLIPNGVTALMDVPIRIEGDVKGVLCFEDTQGTRHWTWQEKQFAFIMAQLVGLSIETNEKIKARKNLENSLIEQKALLREMHHRVKNNLAIISSLVNIQTDKSKDEYHRFLFQDTRNRLNAIAAVHELLYRSKNLAAINFKNYLDEILDHLHRSFLSPKKKIVLFKEIESVEVDISLAVPLALIVNEAITNSYKHAFVGRDKGMLRVSLKRSNNGIMLSITDNGVGFAPGAGSEFNLGTEILHGLVNQIGGIYKFRGENGVQHEIQVPHLSN
jgi:two-component sensor histidine kinase